jgi:hypothetical protein
VNRRGIQLGVAGVLVLIAAMMATIEARHHRKFGHFVGYGLHSDIVVANSDIGTNDTYFAQLWNLSLSTLDVEGCRLPGGYAGKGILYRWDVQKWNPATQAWDSLHGADTWIARPFAGYWNEEACLPEMTHIRPFSARKVAWVYKDWVTTGDAIRIAVHTSATVPPDRQRVVFTELFVIRRPPDKPPMRSLLRIS